MNFTYENQGTATYLVYTVSPGDNIDSMSLGMLTNNSISGLAKAVFTQMDTDKYIKYNVSARVSAKQFLFGQVNKKRLIGVFMGIADAILYAEEYMIDVNSILLDLDYIFSDVATCDTVLISLPVTNMNIGWSDPGTFLRDIMFTTQFDQTENCDYVAQIINYLNSSPVFSPMDFKAFLKSISADTKAHDARVSAPELTPALQPPVSQQVSRSDVQPDVPAIPAVPAPSAKKKPEKAPSQVQTDPPIEIPSSLQQSEKIATNTDGNEKQISFLQLLQHYNKENLELYKAQKAAKKENKAAPAPARNAKKQSAGSDFAIPGQDNFMSGFAVPGQNEPAPFFAAANQKNQTPEPAAYAAQPWSGGAAVQIQPQARPQSQVQSQTDMQPQPVMQASPVRYSGMPSAQPAPSFPEAANYGNDDDYGETMILGQESQVQQLTPQLICKRNGQQVLINKPMLRIGRDVGFNDYVISDNKFIGHSHCHIITRNGEYFIVDDNSKNHTYLDGTQVPSGVEVKIAHGQIIRLANEEFEFRLF